MYIECVRSAYENCPQQIFYIRFMVLAVKELFSKSTFEGTTPCRRHDYANCVIQRQKKQNPTGQRRLIQACAPFQIQKGFKLMINLQCEVGNADKELHILKP